MRGFLAALMTLTRLPLWRVITLDKNTSVIRCYIGP